MLFDVLVSIYEDYGITPREAATKIVEHNLWGLDIDERAAQLSYFAVMMKARQYDRRFFTRNVQPHVYSPKGYPEGQEYGSLITVDSLEPAPEQVNRELFDEKYSLALNRWNFRHALSQKYHVVVTNPPYMGSRNGMNSNLCDYVNRVYPDTKADMYSAFIEKCGQMAKQSGYYSMITQHGWMFLTSFTNLRCMVLHDNIISLLHLGPRAFDEISGEVVQSASFVLQKLDNNNYKGTYCRLINGSSENEKEHDFFDCSNRFIIQKSAFKMLEENQIAYWLSDNMFSAFENKTLGYYAKPRQGMATSDNNLFLRLWHEVEREKAFLDATNEDEAKNSGAKWFPYNKGGGFRKWYGNNDYFINWENNGVEVKALALELYGCVTRTIKNIQFYFKPGITWSTLSSGIFNARYCKHGFLFDTKGSTCFFDHEGNIPYFTAFLNSNVANELLKILAPTLDYNAGSIAKLPVIHSPEFKERINSLFWVCVELARKDWDSFETSWDFGRHPLLRNASTVKEAYSEWSQECEERFNQLKANEEELNRIFIDIYGLQDELTPDVEDKDVTVRKADLQREIKSLISYAVGCMFGRYSLDKDGLVYAGGEFSDQWLVVSGQYCLREEVEHAVGEALQRVDCMATSNGACHRDLQTCEDVAKRGTVCVVRPDAESGSVHSIQYCRGTSKKLYEGIRELPVDRKRVECGTANTMYDLCSPEILDAITSGDCSELVRRGWKNAERIDWKTIHYTLTTNHYYPDADNIIPVTDDEYFEDDIVSRFVNFVEVAYGKDTLEENLSFIANALGGKGSSREVIRKYFLNDFFEDHVKIYQKRPIYWLFDSGKKNGFKCLIYMHRYQPDTIARIRTDYVHEQQSRYRTAIADLEQRINGASTGERVKLNKKLTKLQDQATELRLYEEKIHHLADQMIAIDLDDGVKVNYAKFQDVLAKVK